MTTVAAIQQFINEFAPPELAEDWDNVGLLVGDSAAQVERLMTCLTITPESAAEAVQRQAQVIVTHHPLPFRPLQRLTTDDVSGRLLLELIRAGVAIISPHTAFDSAASGINQMLVEKFGLSDAHPLIPSTELDPGLGAARIGRAVPGTTLSGLLAQAKSVFDMSTIRFVGDTAQVIETVAIACGSGGSFLDPAILAGCDCLVTGETNFHSCLAAQANKVGLVLLGHYNSERFAVEALATNLASQFPELEIWSSQSEADPVRHA